MNTEKVLPYFYPPILDQYINQTRTDMEVARLSTLPEPLITLRNNFETTLSLSATLTEMNTARLAELVALYKKPHAILPTGDFIFSHVLPQRKILLNERKHPLGYTYDAKFYIDGKHGFGLGFSEEGEKSPLWLAVTSFSSGREIPAVTNSEAGESVLSPVIVQLQGSSDKTHTVKGAKEKATTILSQLHWEKLFVNVIMEWAHQNRIPELYILPGSKNRWLDPDPESRLERFRMRYDVTAERMGFKMQPNGLYSISLL